MDLHLFPTWEREVHDMLQPLFKELQRIFLAYTRSVSDDSAADAIEMSLDEFHDFVSAVGLETPSYNFSMMCSQFVKANATNTHEAAAMRKSLKAESQSGVVREVMRSRE